MTLLALCEQPADPLSITRRVLAGDPVAWIGRKACRFPQTSAQDRRQFRNGVSDLINVTRDRRWSTRPWLVVCRQRRREGDRIPPADRCAPGEGERGVHVGGLAGASAGSSSHKLEDLPACGEHPGHAIGIDEMLPDYLDLIHARFLPWSIRPRPATCVNGRSRCVCPACRPQDERRPPAAAQASMASIQFDTFNQRLQLPMIIRVGAPGGRAAGRHGDIDQASESCHGGWVDVYGGRDGSACLRRSDGVHTDSPQLAGIRYDRHDARRSDIDVWQREITVHGKGGRPPGS